MSGGFARAIDYSAKGALTGARGALLAVAVGALVPSAALEPSGALALDSTGGTAAPAAVVSTRGTGGTLYVATAPKPRPAKKAAKHTPPRKPAPPKPKPAPNPKPATKPKLVPTPTPSGVPSPAQTAALGAVFPVRGPHSFGNAENRFGAGRAGHIHQGQDVLANEGLPVVAPLAGTIITTGYQAGGAGWYVAEHTTDGVDFFYAHCEAGSLAVKPQASVRAGQQLCLVGQTGDATGPHLHFEVWVGGWQSASGHPIDPLPYLEAWDR